MASIPGADLHYDLQLEFLEAVFGCKRTIVIATEGEAKRSVDLNIPVGVDDGDKMTVERQGHRSVFRGGRRGRLVVRLKVRGHPQLQRIGSTISSCVHVPWSRLPADEGYVLTVLTVDGPVEVELPCKLDDDMTIVIENKGVPYPDGRGIHHVHIRRGRPHERFLRQIAEVVMTAAVISFCTVVWGHLHQKVAGRPDKEGPQHGTEARCL